MTELRAILPDRDRPRKRILVVVHELQMSRKNLSLSSIPLMNMFFSTRHLSSTAFFGRKQSRLNGILDSFQDLHAYSYACVILVKVCFFPLSKWEVTQVVSEPDGDRNSNGASQRRQNLRRFCRPTGLKTSVWAF